jgi:hypothetical protein
MDKELLNFCNETNNYKYLRLLVCNYYYTRHVPHLLQLLGYMEFPFSYFSNIVAVCLLQSFVK